MKRERLIVTIAEIYFLEGDWHTGGSYRLRGVTAEGRKVEIWTASSKWSAYWPLPKGDLVLAEFSFAEIDRTMHEDVLKIVGSRRSRVRTLSIGPAA